MVVLNQSLMTLLVLIVILIVIRIRIVIPKVWWSGERIDTGPIDKVGNGLARHLDGEGEGFHVPNGRVGDDGVVEVSSKSQALRFFVCKR